MITLSQQQQLQQLQSSYSLNQNITNDFNMYGNDPKTNCYTFPNINISNLENKDSSNKQDNFLEVALFFNTFRATSNKNLFASTRTALQLAKIKNFSKQNYRNPLVRFTFAKFASSFISIIAFVTSVSRFILQKPQFVMNRLGQSAKNANVG